MKTLPWLACAIGLFPALFCATAPAELLPRLDWGTPDVRLVHLYTAASREELGQGITSENIAGDILLRLTTPTPSDLKFTELSPFDLRGVVRADVAAIHDGDTTIRIACWDANGKFLDSVPVLTNINSPGTYEMTFSAYRSIFPAATRQISLQIWLGARTGAAVTFRSFAYGIATTAQIPPPVHISENYAPAVEGTWNLPGKPPFVICHYLDWFSLETPVGGQTWNHWSNGSGPHSHDATHRLPDGKRDIASILYPLIGAYDSSAPDVVRYHLATMKAAGISGVVIDWYGPGSNSDACLPVILDEADKLGMRVGLCYEEKVPTVWKNPTSRQEMLDNAVKDLSYLLTTWGSRHAYLKRDGIPWVMQFNSYGTGSLGPLYLTPDEDRDVFARLPSKLVYCRQNLDPIFHPPVQGAYIWWTEGNGPADFARNAADLITQGRLEFFMSMLGVGFNDTGVWGWGDGPRVSKTYGLSVLKFTENNAVLDSPELIQCVTWNDFNEGTCFEPTVQNGFAFVDEVEKFIGRLHGRPVNLADNRIPYEQYLHTCTDRQRQELPQVNPAILQPKP